MTANIVAHLQHQKKSAWSLVAKAATTLRGRIREMKNQNQTTRNLKTRKYNIARVKLVRSSLGKAAWVVTVKIGSKTLG